MLAADPGLAVETAANGSEALQKLAEHPVSVVITDLKMPRVSGLELLEEIQKRGLHAAVIVTTGFGGVEEAVQAMRLGAADFLTKPVDVEHLKLVIARALRERALLAEVAALRQRMQEQFSFNEILSKSASMHAVFELISHVAQTTTTVLIEGETGTGKEQVAPRHPPGVDSPCRGRWSPSTAPPCRRRCWRASCSATRKARSPSAVGQRKGRFELADGGTIFLDEVGDDSAGDAGQAAARASGAALRARRRHASHRGGRARHRRHQSLAAPSWCRTGKFREDLYYRLNVVKIDLPPLRDRREDIPLLATHFAAKYARSGESAAGDHAGGDGTASRCTAGRATSANWKTPSNAPASRPVRA